MQPLQFVHRSRILAMSTNAWTFLICCRPSGKQQIMTCFWAQYHYIYIHSNLHKDTSTCVLIRSIWKLRVVNWWKSNAVSSWSIRPKNGSPDLMPAARCLLRGIGASVRRPNSAFWKTFVWNQPAKRSINKPELLKMQIYSSWRSTWYRWATTFGLCIAPTMIAIVFQHTPGSHHERVDLPSGLCGWISRCDVTERPALHRGQSWRHHWCFDGSQHSERTTGHQRQLIWYLVHGWFRYTSTNIRRYYAN